MISRLLYRVVLFVSRWPKWTILGAIAAIVVLPFIGIIGAKIYQYWDTDAERGAVAVAEGEFGENYSTPEYLGAGDCRTGGSGRCCGR